MIIGHWPRVLQCQLLLATKESLMQQTLHGYNINHGQGLAVNIFAKRISDQQIIMQ